MAISNSWLIEAYTAFAISVSVILLRVLARTKLVGIRRWQADDYLILLALTVYCVQAWLWSLLQTASSPSTPPVTIGIRVCSVIYVYLLKSCLLFFYVRLGVRMLWIRISGVAVFLMFVASMPVLCIGRRASYAVVGSFDVITDAALLGLVVPIIYHARLTMRRKVAMGLLLAGAVLAITLGMVGSIMGATGEEDWRWGVREMLFATLITNAPLLTTLFTTQPLSSASEKRQPLDWDDAEAQVQITLPPSRIGSKEPTLIGADDLYTYEVDQRGNLKIVKVKEPERGTISVGLEVDSPVIGMDEAAVAHRGSLGQDLERGFEREEREELPPLVMPLRLLTVAQPPRSPTVAQSPGPE